METTSDRIDFLDDLDFEFKPLHESEEFLLVEEGLKRYGLTYAIAGGYARDTFYNQAPRDLDIAVTGLKTEGQVQDAIGALHNWAKDHDILLEIFTNGKYEEYDFDGLAAVIKCIGGIDIVIWNQGWDLAKVMTKGFDYNINQFYIPVPGLRPVFVGDIYTAGILLPLDSEQEVTPLREVRMKEKARDIGWEIPGPRMLNLLRNLNQSH